MTRLSTAVVAVLAVASLAARPAAAQEPVASPATAQQPAPAPPPPAKWHFAITPLAFYASGLEGEATIRNVTMPFDLSFSDVVDLSEGGLSGGVAASKGPISFSFMGGYSKLGDNVSAPAVQDLDGTLTFTSFQGAFGYQVIRKPKFVATASAGVRYTQLKGEISSGDGSINVEKSVDWTDPFIGAQLTRPLGTRFSLSLAGDVGGFDLSESTSKVTWNLAPTLTFRVPLKKNQTVNLLITGGYKWNHIEFTGEGPSVFQLEQDMAGPMVAMTLVF